MNAFKSMLGMGAESSDGKSSAGSSPQPPKNENDSSNSDAPLSAEDANHHDAEVLEDQNKSIIWAIIKQIKVQKHPQLLCNPVSIPPLNGSFLSHPLLIFSIYLQTPVFISFSRHRLGLKLNICNFQHLSFNLGNYRTICLFLQKIFNQFVYQEHILLQIRLMFLFCLGPYSRS